MGRLYSIYHNMKQRCNNVNHTHYENYGKRGISVCKQWCNFKSFELWALSNGYSKELTLDRKDGSLGYNPTNCRWVTRYEQSLNRDGRKISSSKYKGVELIPASGRYRARITIKGSKRISLGCFATDTEAAMSYNNYVTVNMTGHKLNII